MKLKLAYSPCPNDTFIFDALVNHLIDTRGLEFEVHLEDVQTLNRWAIEDRMDVSKISYGVLPLVLPHYDVLASGGALGKGVGPLLIGRTPMENLAEQIEGLKIAIPGINTTAHLLFSTAFPQAKNKVFVMFNEVEGMVARGEVDAGVIIHENRFTYQQKGLVKWIDLGEYWEEVTQAPIPLGGIVMRKSFDDNLKKTLNSLVQESVQFALARYPVVSEYVQQHAQEMSEDVMRQHIDLYVNNYSLDVDETGERAIAKLLEVYQQVHHSEQGGLQPRIVR